MYYYVPPPTAVIFFFLSLLYILLIPVFLLLALLFLLNSWLLLLSPAFQPGNAMLDMVASPNGLALWNYKDIGIMIPSKDVGVCHVIRQFVGSQHKENIICAPIILYQMTPRRNREKDSQKIWQGWQACMKRHMKRASLRSRWMNRRPLMRVFIPPRPVVDLSCAYSIQ